MDITDSTRYRAAGARQEPSIAFPYKVCHHSYGETIGGFLGDKADVWQGTLALMVLKTIETLGPLVKSLEEIGEEG